MTCLGPRGSQWQGWDWPVSHQRPCFPPGTVSAGVRKRLPPTQPPEGRQGAKWSPAPVIKHLAWLLANSHLPHWTLRYRGHVSARHSVPTPNPWYTGGDQPPHLRSHSDIPVTPETWPKALPRVERVVSSGLSQPQQGQQEGSDTPQGSLPPN